jgi:hypothetical protein
MRFEISVDLSGKVYEYVVAFELPDGFKELRVLEEKFAVDGKPVYQRETAHVKLARIGRDRESAFGIDGHLVHIQEVAGGWLKVMEHFVSDHIADMTNVQDRYMILLIDFDGDGRRMEAAKRHIPQHLSDRVFILGTLTEPEDLKASRKSPYEQIGAAMALDCRQDTDTIWSHELLQHNAGELTRLRQPVRPILF